MSSSSDTLLINNLRVVLAQLNFYFGMFIYAFGISGNLLNILILSQKQLRSNPCIMIFIASSIAGIVAIVSGLTSRVLSGVTTDLSATINWICKLRGFILFASRAATYWLIMLSTFDRWLLSSMDAHRRQLSSKKTSLRGIFLVVFVSIVFHSQLFYCYEANLVGTPLRCFTRNLPCRLLNDLIFSIIAVLCPLALILIFGLMTIYNLSKTRGRVGPATVTAPSNPRRKSSEHDRRQKRLKQLDHHLLLMVFVQVIFLALFTLPLSVHRLYATLTMNVSKSPLQSMIEEFIYQIALICTFLATGMPFYVNTLSGGSVFRKAIISLRDSILRKLSCR